MKIPFTLDVWLKDKSQKVETKDGRPVKIISFEMTDTNDCPIAAQFRLCAGTPVVYLFDKEGHYNGEGASDYDLFIITPEPELSEFEQEVRVCVTKNLTTHIKDENGREMSSTVFIDDDTAKKLAAELLELAEKELEEEVPEMEFTPIENTLEYKAGFLAGKAEALKDLPRWRKEQGEMELVAYGIIGGGVASQENPRVYLNGHSIDLYSLEKLSGFNDDEK